MNPLAPQPMTAEQIADLVRRTRIAMIHSPESSDRERRRAFRDLGWHWTDRNRCAARYVALTGRSWLEAAYWFAVSPTDVAKAWKRIWRKETAN